MSGSVNKVILVGNLGRDPEFTQTQDGRRFGRLSIATSERWRAVAPVSAVSRLNASCSDLQRKLG